MDLANRIAAFDPKAAAYRPGAWLAYAEDQFTEVADCLVDVASRVAWPRSRPAGFGTR